MVEATDKPEHIGRKIAEEVDRNLGNHLEPSYIVNLEIWIADILTEWIQKRADAETNNPKPVTED